MKIQTHRVVPAAVAAFFVVNLFFPIPSSAQTRFYGDGELGFGYLCVRASFPFDSYSGNFHAVGSVPSPDDFPPTPADAQATIAYSNEEDDRSLLVIAACRNNNDANQTFDLAVFIVDQAGAIQPGQYTALTVILDDAETDVVLRDLVEAILALDDIEDLDPLQIEAEYLYGGLVNLSLTETMDSITGTFTGFATNGTYIMSIESGTVAIDFTTVPVESQSWGSVKSLFR